jgi:hypothetical protein
VTSSWPFSAREVIKTSLPTQPLPTRRMPSIFSPEGDKARKTATDASTAGDGTASSSNSRPTTSRKNPNPSPDVFFDYIVPSPDESHRRRKFVLVHHDDDAEGTASNVRASTESEGSSGGSSYGGGDSSDTSGSKLHKVHAWDGDDNALTDDDESMQQGPDDAMMPHQRAHLSKEQRDKVRMLGCWLFGTALRI